MKVLVLACGVLALLLIAARAQLNIAGPLGTGSGFGGSVIAGPSTGITIPLVPCNAGQLDWSDSTGCNLVFAGH